MLARLWQGCACDTEALKQNCATSPSKCIFLYFHSTFVEMLEFEGIYIYIYILFHAFKFLLAHTVLLQCSHGRPGHTSPGQDWGMEEDSQSAGQRPCQRSARRGHYLLIHVVNAQPLVNSCLYLFFIFLWTEYKRSRQEIKRKSLDTMKLQKKARKGETLTQTHSFGEFGDTRLTGW